MARTVTHAASWLLGALLVSSGPIAIAWSQCPQQEPYNIVCPAKSSYRSCTKNSAGTVCEGPVEIPTADRFGCRAAPTDCFTECLDGSDPADLVACFVTYSGCTLDTHGNCEVNTSSSYFESNMAQKRIANCQ